MTPPEAFDTAPKSFCTPAANYIYFDLIVSYLIILKIKCVKLPILWSQMIRSCHAGLENSFVKLFPWLLRALPTRPGQSKQQHPPQIFIHPPNKNMKIRLWSDLTVVNLASQGLLLPHGATAKTLVPSGHVNS
jgi:hypothetical protein